MCFVSREVRPWEHGIQGSGQLRGLVIAVVTEHPLTRPGFLPRSALRGHSLSGRGRPGGCPRCHNGDSPDTESWSVQSAADRVSYAVVSGIGGQGLVPCCRQVTHVGTSSDLPKIKWPPLVQRTYCRTLSPWPGWPFPVTGPQFPHWHHHGLGAVPCCPSWRYLSDALPGRLLTLLH